MKKLVPLLLVFFIFISSALKAQTNVSGAISTNTMWTLVGSLYRLTAGVTVNAGVSLTIQPGVTVEFNDYENIFVNGSLFKGLSDNGNELPSGTYFYKIEFSGGSPTKTGYLTLKR